MTETDHAPSARVRWARLRFQTVGPLLAAPADAGELKGRIEELAARAWRHPTTGGSTHFSFKTIERWWYIARAAKDPFAALARRVHGHAGTHPSIGPALADAVASQHRDATLLPALGVASLAPRFRERRRARCGHRDGRRDAEKRCDCGGRHLAPHEARDERGRHTQAVAHADEDRVAQRVIVGGGAKPVPRTAARQDFGRRLGAGPLDPAPRPRPVGVREARRDGMHLEDFANVAPESQQARGLAPAAVAQHDLTRERARPGPGRRGPHRTSDRAKGYDIACCASFIYIFHRNLRSGTRAAPT
jgi:hypothetical protein